MQARGRAGVLGLATDNWIYSRGFAVISQPVPFPRLGPVIGPNPCDTWNGDNYHLKPFTLHPAPDTAVQARGRAGVLGR